MLICLSHVLPGFQAAWLSRNLYEMKWGFAGLSLVGLSATLTQAVLRADPSSWQLQALSMNRGDHMLFSLSDVFFLASRSSSPEKVSAGLAYLHPHFQVWKAGVHLQSLSIISLCIKPVHAWSLMEQYIVQILCLAILIRPFISIKKQVFQPCSFVVLFFISPA